MSEVERMTVSSAGRLETPWGWASVLLLDRPPRSMLTEKLGDATGDQMVSVDSALRAVLEL